MCSCQPLNRNPKGAPTIQQLTIQPPELSEKNALSLPYFMRQTVERQHNAWFREQVNAGRQQLERGEVLPHDMVEASAAAWRDEMMKKAAGK